MTLTKAKIIEDIHKNCGFTKSKSADLTESILESIKQGLEPEQGVLISGLGEFYVKEKDEREGRNPHTWRRYDTGREEGDCV